MNANELYEQLKPLQEAKGSFFNPDRAMTLDLLASLLTNKERYGYMACPCRLASGTFALDRDVVCPCVYRDPDVAEFGACFCGLYVSPAVRDGKAPLPVVPERRPLEKTLAALG
ncbi:ferredoxin thioredoxin reductase beta chain [Solidesulfovibrio carbinoliphilus subsp. oakridgensis]|uniref:ferredoxin:thioredoxin reductase n=1 Tax=Solidesulfovibrio carbinoliphilus subsp. oakridgensis TaxID=694327 RepID=G7QA07_9BACT|nr:ferredoxin-thioredoxin reductase catalytic domain-containing protein [Solidesulfovibrio carbinoliphilus]EHJ47837.1 ferredoxin thioredoxin reductase beta chain [Solidesulfovibrio carbinoliphilus subsp. oakridgensis]